MTTYNDATLARLRDLAEGRKLTSNEIVKETGMLRGSVLRACRKHGIKLPGSGTVKGEPKPVTLAGPKHETPSIYEKYSDDLKLLREDPADARHCQSCRKPRAYKSRYCKTHYREMYVQHTWCEEARRDFQEERKHK